MKKANMVLRAAMAAAGLAGMVSGVLMPATVMAAEKADKASAEQKIGPKVGKPLKAAQDAIQAKNWDAASASIQEAMAIPDKTPYETYMTNELAWYVAVQQKKYPEAAALLEKQLESGQIPAADLPARTKAMTQLSYQDKDYAKAVQYGNKYLELVPGDQDVGVLVATSYYLQNDYAAARTASQKLIASASPKPSEQMLQLQLRTNVELQDRAGTVKSLEDMIKYYPQKKYWDDLLNQELFMQNSERDLRTLFRLIADTETMDKSDEFAEAASVMIAGGFPTEAQKVLEKGMAANAFEGDAKGRAQTDYERARAGADADRKELPGAPAALGSAKNGNQMVAIGKLYFSVGEYAKAADAIKQGIAKGGVTDVDDANALMGVAYARAHDDENAGKAFDAVKDPRLAEISRLWKLHVETRGQGAVAEAPPAGATQQGTTQ